MAKNENMITVKNFVEVSEALPQKQVITFDVFDTLVYRKYLSFDRVVALSSAYALSVWGATSVVDDIDAVSRLRWTTSSMMKGRDRHGEEPSLLDVWTEVSLPQTKNLEDAQEAGRKIADFEFAIERRNLAPIKGGKELLEMLKRSGKRLIAISDMYFSLHDITLILADAGLKDLFEEIFVSSDKGLTKQTGGLFKHAWKHLGVEADETCHVGDNPLSDVKKPISLGGDGILIQHERYTDLKIINYGNRSNINLEIADLCKVFIYQIMFFSQKYALSSLYFLARDGILIREIYEKCMSGILRDHFDHPELKDLCLNRSSTNWLRVDFTDGWLERVVRHAFFLNGGAATGRFFFKQIGLDVIPAGLSSEETYTAQKDISLIVSAIEGADLSKFVKEAIQEKKDHVTSYLKQEGFFNNSSVAFVDIGYSGTVVCSINELFLKRDMLGENISLPHMYFLCLASNAFFSDNAVRAQPYASFVKPTLLPFEKLPADLSEGFAWLEYFFKHRSLGGFEGYEKKDGRIEPIYGERLNKTISTPSVDVLNAVEEREDDLVLLWMAATQNVSDFIEPLIQRFSQPDISTMLQMEVPVYETDASHLSERGIILKKPGAHKRDVYDEARENDCWISGSIAYSEYLWKIDQEENTARENNVKDSNYSRKNKKLFKFDAKFYRAYYPELGYGRTDEELETHYNVHGAVLGRFSCHAEMLSAYKKRKWSIPEAFYQKDYHKFDIKSVKDLPWMVSHNAIRKINKVSSSENDGMGHYEKVLFPIPSCIEDSFEEKLFSRKILLTPTEQERYRAGQLNLTECIFLRFKVLPGPWLLQFDAEEFSALNVSWYEGSISPADALMAFLKEGIGRSASLTKNYAFDATFYIKNYLSNKRISNEEAYRDWLNRGVFLGYPPSDRFALQGDPVTSGDDKDILVWKKIFLGLSSLFKKDGLGKRLTYEEWLERGRRYRQQNMCLEAENAFLNAINLNRDSALVWHELGDLYYNNDNKKALIAFEKSIECGSSNRWAYKHAMSLNILQENYERAFRLLLKSAKIFKESHLWRMERQNLFQNWFLKGYNSIDNNPKNKRKFTNKFIKKIESSRSREDVNLSKEDGYILILLGDEIHDRILFRKWLDEEQGNKVKIFTKDTSDYLFENLASASLLIFNNVTIDGFSIDLLLSAKQYGVRSVFWGGRLTSGGVLAGEKGLGLSFDESHYKTNKVDLSNPSWMLDASMLGYLCDDVYVTNSDFVPYCQALQLKPVFVRNHYVRSLSEINFPLWKNNKKVFISFLSYHGSVKYSPKYIINILLNILYYDPDISLFIEGMPSDVDIPTVLMSRIEFQADILDYDARMAILSVSSLVIDARQTSIATLWFSGALVRTPVITLTGEEAYVKPPAGAVSDPKKLLPSVKAHLNEKEQVSGLRESDFVRYEEERDEISFPNVKPSYDRKERKHVMIVNLFAPPQTIGGASRVVENNLEYFLKDNDEIDFSVLAVDDFNDSPGKTRVDNWHGIPVFRIASPYEPNMYWRGYNAEIEAYVYKVMKRIRPDMVHIHCLQRLTVAVIDVCRTLGIPYIITLHDSWWLSDYPFLVSEDGSRADLNIVPSEQTYSQRIGLPRSLARAIRLRDALRHAELLIGVSRSYSQLYRNLGFDVLTVENGISPPTNLTRVPGTGLVRLAHFGGMEWHKGAHILKRALEKGKFSNLTLMIMDFDREEGVIDHEMWGTTPVTIRSKVLPSMIEELYNSTDVVVAASTCPESYGLVAREGLAHGCWVIANTDGAMGDDIIVEKNGFLVDTSTPDDLCCVLKYIDENYQLYTRSPEIKFDIRTSVDQGRDILGIYKDYLSKHEKQ